MLLAFCGFVVFNNLSLQYNSVGTYQLWKVLTTPVIVAIQYFLHGVELRGLELLTLLPILVGVMLATAAPTPATHAILTLLKAGECIRHSV